MTSQPYTLTRRRPDTAAERAADAVPDIRGMKPRRRGSTRADMPRAGTLAAVELRFDHQEPRA